jgi:hypothetical protein
MPKTTEPKREGGSRPPDADEDLAWLNAAPVGREFGSPDYERLMALDQAAFAAFHSWDRVRQWLATPNPQLNGACPDDVARSPDGLSQLLSALMVVGDSASDDIESSGED